jgi:hypothetical protein
VWSDRDVVLRPETFTKEEEQKPAAEFIMARGETATLRLPSALSKDPPGQWIFWPSGNCEPAVVSFKSGNGAWAANYSPLTARAEVISYVPR